MTGSPLSRIRIDWPSCFVMPAHHQRRLRITVDGHRSVRVWSIPITPVRKVR